MTARNQTLLAWFAFALAAVASALRIADAFSGGVVDRSRLLGAAGIAPAMVITLILVAHARRLEAEHGPDYVQPIRHKRMALVLAWGAALVLAGIAAWLHFRR
jgi:hypothetical protein